MLVCESVHQMMFSMGERAPRACKGAREIQVQCCGGVWDMDMLRYAELKGEGGRGGIHMSGSMFCVCSEVAVTG